MYSITLIQSRLVHVQIRYTVLYLCVVWVFFFFFALLPVVVLITILQIFWHLFCFLAVFIYRFYKVSLDEFSHVQHTSSSYNIHLYKVNVTHCLVMYGDFLGFIITSANVRVAQGFNIKEDDLKSSIFKELLLANIFCV